MGVVIKLGFLVVGIALFLVCAAILAIRITFGSGEDDLP